jgi:hypothetical protein
MLIELASPLMATALTPERSGIAVEDIPSGRADAASITGMTRKMNIESHL